MTNGFKICVFLYLGTGLCVEYSGVSCNWKTVRRILHIHNFNFDSIRLKWGYMAYMELVVFLLDLFREGWNLWVCIVLMIFKTLFYNPYLIKSYSKLLLAFYLCLGCLFPLRFHWTLYSYILMCLYRRELEDRGTFG